MRRRICPRLVVASALLAAAAACAQPALPPGAQPAEFMRDCSYRLWYPWYVANQSKRPADPEPPRPEPDGPRDPVGEKCLERLRAEMRQSGRPLPGAAQVVELRAAAKAGKAAALYQAFEELKASRRRP